MTIQSNTGRRAAWRDGLFATAVGRWGGLHGFTRPRVGLPLWTADSLALYDNAEKPGDEREFLRYCPEHTGAVHERTNWTVRTSELRYIEKGRETIEATIYDSQAWPARLIVSRQKQVRFYGEPLWSCIPVCPTRHGLVAHNPARTAVSRRLPRADWAYDRHRDGPLAEPWMLLAFYTGTSAILQVTFQRHPLRVVRAGRGIEFHFAGAAGAMVISAPFGIKTPPAGLSGRLAAIRRLPWRHLRRKTCSDVREAVRRAREWAPCFLSYPEEIYDQYRFDERFLYIRQSARHRVFRDNDWGVKPQRLLPVPPVLCRLLEKDVDHPLTITPPLAPVAMDVRYYRQRFVAADRWEIRLPRERWVSHTLAPLRVANDPRFADIQDRMARYLRNPDMTFHGDHTFDRANVQDCFANYRATAPAAWAVDEKTRQALWKRIEVGVRNLRRAEFMELTEPLTGRRWLAQKDIWNDPHNTVDWDWYIGQLAAGVWNKHYYQGRDLAWLRRVFPILEGQFSHYRIYMDWAIQSGWCDLQRNNRWLDGLFYVVHGLIGFARLAKELGKTALAEEAEYYLLQHVALRDAAVYLRDYALECGAQPVLANGLSRQDATIKGFFDRENFGVCLVGGNVPFGGSAIGIDIPEYLAAALERPALLRELRRNNEVLLPKALPDWNIRFTRDGKGRGPLRKHPIDISHTHFYFLYDYLIIEAIARGAPIETLKRLVHLDDLAADMLLVYTQATHPMLLVPADADFQGCVWDAAARTMSLNLGSAVSRRSSDLFLIGATGPVQVAGATRRPAADTRAARAYRLDPDARQVVFTFMTQQGVRRERKER